MCKLVARPRLLHDLGQARRTMAYGMTRTARAGRVADRPHACALTWKRGGTPEFRRGRRFGPLSGIFRDRAKDGPRTALCGHLHDLHTQTLALEDKSLELQPSRFALQAKRLKLQPRRFSLQAERLELQPRRLGSTPKSRTVVKGLRTSGLAWRLFAASLGCGTARCIQTHRLLLHRALDTSCGRPARA